MCIFLCLWKIKHIHASLETPEVFLHYVTVSCWTESWLACEWMNCCEYLHGNQLYYYRIQKGTLIKQYRNSHDVQIILRVGHVTSVEVEFGYRRWDKYARNTKKVMSWIFVPPVSPTLFSCDPQFGFEGFVSYILRFFSVLLFFVGANET